MKDITVKLNRLAEMQAQVDVINLHFDELRDSLLTPEIKIQLEEIETERTSTLDALQEGIAALEAEIRENVLTAGKTIRGAHIQAVWMRGRITWDTQSLDSYAQEHPEVLTFRRQGRPSVSLRKVR